MKIPLTNERKALLVSQTDDVGAYGPIWLPDAPTILSGWRRLLAPRDGPRRIYPEVSVLREFFGFGGRVE